MPKELQPIADAFGSIVDSAVVQFSIRAIALYFVVLWLAAAYWAFRDLQSRTDNPIAPYLAAAFLIVATPVLFPFAIVVYRVVRPQERLGEVYERNLAEEALLAEVEAIKHCPGCNRRVHDEWIICPTCRTRLNRVCPNCSRLVGLDWTLCAWCGKDFERREAAAAVLEPIPGGLDQRPAFETQARPQVRTTVRSASRVRAAAASATSASVPTADPLPEH